MTSSYSKISVFVRTRVNKKPAFSKISTLESVFEKMRFVTVFIGYVWTGSKETPRTECLMGGYS